MSKYDRSIKCIFDNEQRKIIDLNEAIKFQKEGFQIRDQYNSNTNRFSCPVCDQTLVCSNSSKDLIYFRHLPNAEYCVLLDFDLNSKIHTNSEFTLAEAYKRSAINRESPRHKELKNKIGQLLKKEPFVDVNSIDVDSKFILGIGGKRRPDVYCEYNGKKLAFEIQLSNLPLHYIKHRYNFYRQNGIYLIWIIDFKNKPNDLSNFQRDIKYVWEHQNLFSIDDNENSKLVFECFYKTPYIIQNNAIHDKWTKSKISLKNLTFNFKEYFCFYYHYGFELSRKENEIIKIKFDLERKILEEQEILKRSTATTKVKSLLAKIKKYKQNSWNFYSIKQDIDDFGYLEIEVLNSHINWNQKIEGIPLILYYIKQYKFGVDVKESSMNVVEFLLTTQNFSFDINEKDHLSKGVLDYIYDNTYLLKRLYKVERFIFCRGYIPTEQDKKLLISVGGKLWDAKWYEWMYYSKFKSLHEIEKVRNILSFLLFVESAIKMQIIGKNVTNWVQYLTFVLNQNKELHQHFITVLNNTRLGNELRFLDKKNTIAKKLESLANHETDLIYNEILVTLYSEIFDRLESKNGQELT